jgi:uncharacterized membrane protein HdeD (DUF308 family)
LNPPATILSVAWVIAIYAVIAGVALIGFGLRLRQRRQAEEAASLEKT